MFTLPYLQEENLNIPVYILHISHICPLYSCRLLVAILLAMALRITDVYSNSYWLFVTILDHESERCLRGGIDFLDSLVM